MISLKHVIKIYFQVVALISITFIILSTVVLTLNTLPYFDKRDENNNERDYPPFALLEAVYMSWFTFEFLVSGFHEFFGNTTKLI